MPDVSLGRLNRYVEKFLNIKGGPTVVDFAHQMVLDIPLLVGVEDRALQGWNRFSFFASQTGAAGANAAIQIRNPPGSNVVAVIEKIEARIGVLTNSTIQIGFNAGPAGIADLTVAGSASRLDGRINTGSSLICSSSTNTALLNPGILSGSVNNGLPYNAILMPDQELPLLPGSACMIFDLTVAESLSASFMWRERALESSELT